MHNQQSYDLEDNKFINLLQQQLLLRKESIYKRMVKRQNELKILEKEMNDLVEDFQKTRFFENNKKKIIKFQIEKCEQKIAEIIEANQRDSIEMKKLNEI